MIISSWNVNSVRARIENISNYLKKYSPDILMMQEIKTEEINFPFDEFKKLKYNITIYDSPLADVRWSTSNGRRPMADVRWSMADVRWPMADGRWPIVDVRCPMPDARYTYTYT